MLLYCVLWRMVSPKELATKKRNIGSTSGILGELVRRLNSTCATGFQDPCILAIGDVALYQSLFQCVYHIAVACIPKQLGFWLWAGFLPEHLTDYHPVKPCFRMMVHMTKAVHTVILWLNLYTSLNAKKIPWSKAMLYRVPGQSSSYSLRS